MVQWETNCFLKALWIAMLNQGHNNLDNPITQKAEKNFFFCIEQVSDGNEKGIKMTVQRHSLR